MRAIQQTEFGGPEVLELVELPDPVPGEGELLIDVTYAGVNFADTHQREDGYVAAQSLPRIPGAEVAGVRADTGERVVALVSGGYAERVVAPADRVFEMAGGAVFDTALDALADCGRLVVYGISSREQNEVRTGRLLKRSQSVIGFWLYHYLGQRRHLEVPLAQLFALAAAGDIEARIGATYPLADAAQAQIDLAARTTSGKLLIEMPH